MSERILILEDDPERIREFLRKFIGNVVVVTGDTRKAITSLQIEHWDFLFLDHDLDGLAYVPSGPGTGYEVAEWLSKNREHMPGIVVIHSYNEYGRRNMLNVLPWALEKPGVWSSNETLEDLENESRGA